VPTSTEPETDPCRGTRPVLRGQLSAVVDRRPAGRRCSACRQVPAVGGVRVERGQPRTGRPEAPSVLPGPAPQVMRVEDPGIRGAGYRPRGWPARSCDVVPALVVDRSPRSDEHDHCSRFFGRGIGQQSLAGPWRCPRALPLGQAPRWLSDRTPARGGESSAPRPADAPCSRRDAVRPPLLLLLRVDEHNGAGRVLRTIMAHRAEEEVGEGTVAAGSPDQKIGVK
jgi:hypothetical protein